MLFLVPVKIVICLLEQLICVYIPGSRAVHGFPFRVHGPKVMVIVQFKLDVKNMALNKGKIFILKARNAFILNYGVYPVANLLLLLFI